MKTKSRILTISSDEAWELRRNVLGSWSVSRRKHEPALRVAEVFHEHFHSGQDMDDDCLTDGRHMRDRLYDLGYQIVPLHYDEWRMNMWFWMSLSLTLCVIGVWLVATK
jgi:hypothetical protein